jgi:hypothetical protein
MALYPCYSSFPSAIDVFFLLQKVLLFIVIWIVLQISMELFWYKIIWKGLDVGLGQNRCLALKILYLQSLIDVHF